MAGMASDGHVAVFLELGVVAARLLGNAIAKEASREADILVLHWKHLVEASQIVQLMHSSLVNFLSEFFASHLIPEKRALLVHLFELSVPHDPIQVLLSVGLSGSKYLKRVRDDRLLHLVVKCTVRLKRGCLVDLEEPRLRISVDQHIKSEHLKAHVERAIVWLACPIVMEKVGLHRDQRLNNQVGDLKLEQIYIDTILP